MNKEQYNNIIDEVYDKYTDKYIGYEDVPNRELFIHEIKNNPKFSEKWGLKIEERELSLEERLWLFINRNNGSHPEDIEVMDDYEIPTKLITVTYNNETIEVYE